jgi:hypothetical protein
MASEDEAVLMKLYQENPGLRRQIQVELKKKNPALVFPELEAEEQVRAVEKTFGEQLAQTNEDLTRTRVELVRAQKHAQWREQGYAPADIEATIERYGLTGSKDVTPEQAAMAILNNESAVAGAAVANPREHGRMRIQDSWKNIANKSDATINGFAQDEAYKAIDELRAGDRQRQRGFQSTPINVGGKR